MLLYYYMPSLGSSYSARIPGLTEDILLIVQCTQIAEKGKGHGGLKLSSLINRKILTKIKQKFQGKIRKHVSIQVELLGGEAPGDE